MAAPRHESLAGCGLPERWRGRDAFTVLQVGPGAGLNFLHLWDAWRADARRCARLHCVAVMARAPDGAELPPHPLSAAFAAALATRPLRALPGLHRLAFRQGDCTLVLTLAIGSPAALLPQLRLAADAICIDDATLAPEIARTIARLARPHARFAAPAALRKPLTEAGFVVDAPSAGGESISGAYAPAWPRPAGWPRHAEAPHGGEVRAAIVIGAGIAGACTAHALAQRGWRVSLLDAAPGPGGGASGLPAGLMVPHVSPDDAPMSRLTRAGAESMRALIDAIGLPSAHWRAGGVLQRVDDAHKARAPAAWGAQQLFELRETPGGGPARYFPHGIAIAPGPLVRQLLESSPGLQVRWGSAVRSLERAGDGWAALDARGEALAAAPVVIVCAALASLDIARGASAGGQDDAGKVLRPVRGQVTLGSAPLPDAFQNGPALSGDGHFIPALRPGHGPHWVMGASFERGETGTTPTPSAHAGNLDKLGRLSPALATLLAPQFGPGEAGAWVGVRCTSPDRLPLVGPVGAGRPGVFMLAALGSRGLSLAAVCAELLACQLNDEPWPVEGALGDALSPARFA